MAAVTLNLSVFTLLVLRKKIILYPSVLKYCNLAQIPYTIYLGHLTYTFAAFHFFFFCIVVMI
jgi:hypothetical protein